MVRIIAGALKGRKISVPERVRPTLARVRKAIFQMVDVRDKDICDLFSGSGAMGIESISRGAKNVVFVEKSARNAAKLRDTIKKTDISGKVIVADAFVFVKNASYTFDIIFMDPPYNKGLASNIIPYLFDILNKGGIIVIEVSKFESIQGGRLKLVKLREYGDTKVIILKKE